MGTLEVIRVVLDTNVLVSGLLFGGTPGKLLDLWKAGTIRLIMSRVMLDEFLSDNFIPVPILLLGYANRAPRAARSSRSTDR